MIVVMRPGATEQEITGVKTLIREMGLKDQVIVGTDLTVVAAIGDERLKDCAVVESAPGVDKVMRVLAPYKLAAIETKQQQRTVIKLSETCVFGGVQVPVIAGPCSVEGEEHILQCARLVKAAGGHALRGGAFKPRTNPYSFQGHGEDGLKMLAAAREETGLPIVTEVVTPSDVELVSEYADCLQIGTRNCQNFKLLEACGNQPKPVLYKRGMSMTIDEYLQAAEYILAEGNPNVILCERGIRTFEDHTRNTLSLSAVPELQHRSHLPIVIDPSHGTGHARLVPAMAKAAVAAGADGLAIEMHPDPAHAMTDGAQSITPAVMEEMMLSLGRIAEAVDRECVKVSEMV
ncbi:3-deoxy-7-phosphoheptulonate synthase [Poriferisphaera sp. WC338]|uniref:3-deoxy-7-phosphoheptulonate synthase n=1 Tax=Poriferisphaera sp. WC338 TaxID=3425129 RepID=UPI003D8173F8